jgi:hypothetical protein
MDRSDQSKIVKSVRRKRPISRSCSSLLGSYEYCANIRCASSAFFWISARALLALVPLLQINATASDHVYLKRLDSLAHQKHLRVMQMWMWHEEDTNRQSSMTLRVLLIGTHHRLLWPAAPMAPRCGYDDLFPRVKVALF